MNRQEWDRLSEKQRIIMARLVYAGYCIITDLGPEFCALEDAPGKTRTDIGLDCTVTVEDIKELQVLGLVEQTTLGWEPTRHGEILVKRYGH
ncbi:MAG: hypothetical protein IBX71_11370 [Candidatus Desulforudis sp.]|nr:hypothetical protein [Desulforudis sp.]